MCMYTRVGYIQDRDDLHKCDLLLTITIRVGWIWVSLEGNAAVECSNPPSICTTPPLFPSLLLFMA